MRAFRYILSCIPERFLQRVNSLFADRSNIQTVGLWTSAVVAALISIVYAKLFQFAEVGFQKLLSSEPQFSYWVFAISPVLFLLAWFVVRRFSPEASGSGIPQIMLANELDYSGDEKRAVDRLLSPRTAIVKIVSSLLCVLGGGAIGREGPTLQICASVFHFFGKRIRKFTPHMDEHTLVVAGAASGLASAFNTPLGGIVYAIEELGLVHFHKVRTAVLSGVIVSGLIAQSILGNYLYIGFPDLAPIGYLIPFAALLCGILTGLSGAMFGKYLLVFLNKRLALKKPFHLAMLTMGCGLTMACLAFWDYRASGTGTHVIVDLLFNKDSSSIVLVIIRYIATTVSYLSGAAGGIFSPSLAMGATMGSYIGEFIAPHHPHLMVLLGMIGFLTGMTRTPFTSFILVLEMTDRHSAIFPMMITAVTAHWISQLIDSQSFYEHVKGSYRVSVASPSP